MKNTDIFSKIKLPATGQARGKAASTPPPSQRQLIFMGWTAAIFLCIALSVFAIFFASCTAADALPPESAPTTEPSDITPSGGTDDTVSPAL